MWRWNYLVLVSLTLLFALELVSCDSETSGGTGNSAFQALEPDSSCLELLQAETRTFSPGEVDVSFAAGINQQQAEDLMAQYSLSANVYVAEQSAEPPTYVATVQVPAGSEIDTSCRLEGLPEVFTAHPDYITSPTRPSSTEAPSS